MLHVQFPEDMQFLLDVDELQSMFAGNVNCAFDKSDGGECAAQLIDLNKVSPRI